MTRINCIPVTELTSKHLLAEYRELPRVRHAYPRKASASIPPAYVLGKGHVTFFYDKGLWLEQRHAALIAEMRRRGYTVNLPPLDLGHWPQGAMNNWRVTDEAMRLNRERISQRLAGK